MYAITWFFLHFVQLKKVQVDPKESLSIGFDVVVPNAISITMQIATSILFLFILIVQLRSTNEKSYRIQVKLSLIN